MSKVAIVTGGTRGIGEAIALALKHMGYTVASNYAGNEAKAQEFTERTGIPSFKWDVGDHQACLDGCAAVSSQLGDIDVVVNNAGITRDGVLANMSFDDWNEVMRINLGGCFNMAKATFGRMRQRGWGRIVNIGSVNGQAGQYGQVNYAAAKSGIHGFTKALAQEGAKYGVTVNAIAPGYVDTDMVAAVPQPVLEKIVAKIPVGRLGNANEIARGVAFLCSDEASFITGSTMSINGGQHILMAAADETDGPAASLFSPPVKRSVTIAGHQTAISLEPIFWSALRSTAAQEGLPVNALIARIDVARMAAADPPNLASALRCWLMAEANRIKNYSQ